MALITRLSRLFQADFHAVLDCIEEPDIQLKQAVREMEFDLLQDQQTLALLQHEGQQQAISIDDATGKIAAFDEELDICFSANKEDLARDLIRRKLETGAALAQAEKHLVSIKTNIDKLRQRIEEHRLQLENMQQKLELLVDENGPGIYGNHAHTAGYKVRSEDIEIAYLREQQKRAVS